MITKFDSLYAGAPESMMLEQLEWFAAEVMPAFTKRGTRG